MEQCILFRMGRCTKQDSCSFRHDTDPSDEDKQHAIFSCYFSGAFVHFDNDGRLSKMVLPSDVSAVRINGIPLDYPPALVSKFLRKIHPDARTASFRVSNSKRSRTSCVDVEFEKTIPAKQFWTRFKFAQSVHRRYAGLEASCTPPIECPEPDLHRIDSIRIHVSWQKPTRLVWLNFESHRLASARRTCQRFNTGVYTIYGQRVTASEPKLKSPRGRGTYTFADMLVAVLLEGVPYQAIWDDVQSSIQDIDKPNHLELVKDNEALDFEAVRSFVDYLLTRLGSVDFRMCNRAQDERYKAIAHFQDEDRAWEAVRLLRNRRLGYLNRGQLTVKVFRSTTFKLRTDLYNTLEITQLSKHGRSLKDRRLRIKVYTYSEQLTAVSIEGEEAAEVATMSAEMERTLRGRRVENGNRPVWSTAITNGLLSQVLNHVQNLHGVVLVRSVLKREIRFFGPACKYAPIRDIIVNILSTMAFYVIPLDFYQFSMAGIGKFDRIMSVLGIIVIFLDTVSKTRKVLIDGSQTKYRTAYGIIQQENSFADLNDVDQVCNICWSTAESPVLTSCKHIYCQECFENLCLFGLPGNSKPSICCVGDKGNCRKVFSLQELQDRISCITFEKMLKDSFSSYIRSRPQSFRHSPTAGCGYLYRITSTPENYTCLGCSVTICTSCHEQHSSMTCADHRDFVSGGQEALRKYKQEMGIKDCPRCTTPLEKTEGCNHVECRACGAHICWQCLETYADHQQVYAHLNAVHGSFV